jgi:hypothetical protein
MAQYEGYDYEQKRREEPFRSNKQSSYLNRLYKGYGDQLRSGSPLHHIEQYLQGLNSTFIDEAEAKGLYDKRLNDITKAFRDMQTEQEQKWSTWNARWDEANKPQLLDVGNVQQPIGGVNQYQQYQQSIADLNRHWGNQFGAMQGQFGAMQGQYGNLQQQLGHLQGRQFSQEEQQRNRQSMLEGQIRDRQRRRTSDWAGPRQDRNMWDMYGGQRYSGGYGGGGYNDQLTIDNLNI